MKVVRVWVAFLCLSETVASVKVIVEEVKGYGLWGEMHRFMRRIDCVLYLPGRRGSR